MAMYVTDGTDFKIGDKVKIIDNSNYSSLPMGKEGVIINYNYNDGYRYYIVDFGYGSYQTMIGYQLALVDKKLIINEEKNMNVREKFILAVTPEPKKSFRKAGITDGDDFLTDEGVKVFLTWLLHNKYSAEFKKDVVDDILEEQRKEEKKK